jgi:hypothetical protein
MTEYVKNMHTEFKLFELYGLRDVATAAEQQNVAAADFVPLAEAILPEGQARAFAARWPTLTAAERTEIGAMLATADGSSSKHSPVNLRKIIK